MAIVKGLLKRLGKYRDGIYPYTQTDCVFDENGNSLDGILSNINTNKQNTLIAGRGIGITGNTINNNFESLIGDATIATGDKLVIRDASNSNNLAGALGFNTSNTHLFLNNAGQWNNPFQPKITWYKSYSSSSEAFPLNNTIQNANLTKCYFVIMTFLDEYGAGSTTGETSFCFPVAPTSGSYRFRAEHGGNYRLFYFLGENIYFTGGNSASKMLPTRIWGF